MSFMQLILCLPRIGYSSLVWVIAFIFRHFPTWRRPARSIYDSKMNVVGLLGTTNLPEDWWIATDFLVWKHLLSDARRAEWYSGVDFDSSSFSVVLGDPYADRLRFNLDQTGITLVPEVPSIKTDFLFGVAEMLGKVDKEDIAVIVLCSNCELNGDVRLGGGSQVLEHFRRRHLERALRACPIPAERLFVVSTARYSGQWRSPRWTLLAAAESHQQSDAMRPSGSGHARGSFFTWTISAEQADEHGLSPPLTEEIVYPSDFVFPRDIDPLLRHPPKAGNLCDPTEPRVLESPRRSTKEALAFMHRLRDRIGGVYKSTTFVLHPESDHPSRFPSCSFGPEFLNRFQIIPASPPDATPPVSPISSEASNDETAPLTADEQQELFLLSAIYRRTDHPPTSSNVPVIIGSATFAPSLSPARMPPRAAAIAEHFEWTSEVPVEKWSRSVGLARMQEAETAGARILSYFLAEDAEGARVGENQPLWRPLGPAEWLAEAWARAGRPAVEESGWSAAIEYATSTTAH
ncbi:Glycoside hydrolase family 76 protein [Mycena venus]|uniref:Glycoside hydrolase family 76 protein n=1 Tax=Mycena venus TaxID=2733690 RepID=A0A8H6X777_9AGAR|nr:Glycoside hydrolase family 76 protein [Mycena venus]